MICKLKETVKKYDMLKHGSEVVVGVSGGADSCALLYALCEIREEYQLKLTAVHINHGIRGGEAQRDELFVKELCQKLDVNFKSFHFDVPNMAKKQGIGVEECGRKLRYQAFESVSQNALIATAHNLNDCCETLLFNLTRGSSVKGLASIPAVRGKIIRPLIECSRDEIEAYLRDKGASFVTDSTNAQTDYSRNKIRLNIIPELKKINPSFENSVLRLTQTIKEENDYFSSLVCEIVNNAKTDDGYSAQVILNNHIAVIKRVVAFLIEKELGFLPENKHILAVCDILKGGKTQILKNKTVVVKNGILSFNQKKETNSWETDFLTEKEIKIPNGEIKFEIIYNNSSQPIQFVHKDVLDYSSVSGEIKLRSRKVGDEIRIANRNCTKTLKKLFTEAKIIDKNSVAVLADDNGVLWVEGFGCDERCKISRDTQKVLKINIKRGV